MNRREFLTLCGGLMMATELNAMPKLTAEGANAVDKKFDNLKLNIRQLKIDVGAIKSFGALHVSDSHMTRADERDGERKMNLAAGRYKIFPFAEHYFDLQIRYALAKGLMMIHTGDMIDFVSERNHAFIRSQLRVGQWVASTGNHEYSLYVGEAKEDEAYKAQSRTKLQKAYGDVCNVTFNSKVINGVNFVSVDDVYYNFTREQLELFKREVKKGLPIVMLCHVPLYTPKHCEANLKSNGGRCAYVTGAPLEITSKYQCDPSLPESEQWRNRSVQQFSDEPTLEFIAWLKEQPLLKAILCGHCHRFYEEQFSPTAKQYIVGAGYTGDCYEIEFI